jgi:BirA family biotin operon repressor/biotin-[acetyl-CoA-carboxylase] ligase
MALLTHWDGEPVQVWARLWSSPLVEVHDVLGSTNDRARNLAEGGARPFSVVVAEQQSAGRGRGGSSWHSPAGAGLWISALLPDARPPVLHVPLLVALATARAAEEVCRGLSVGLKWPNDLVVRGRKVGGILCEHGHGPVVAGVGVNVRQRRDDFPEALGERATSLEAAACGRVSMGALATELLSQLHCLVPAMTTELPTEIHQELVDRDVLRDRPVVSDQVGQGTARGLDGDGALLVERPGGAQVRVVAGSVRTWYNQDPTNAG